MTLDVHFELELPGSIVLTTGEENTKILLPWIRHGVPLG